MPFLWKVRIILFIAVMFFVQIVCAQEEDKSGQEVAAPDTLRKYTVQEVVVQGVHLREEKLVGPNRQPEWTFDRRFPSTRVYIQTKQGEVEFEQWIEMRVPSKKSDKTQTRLDQELAFGLLDRLQLDIYVNTLHVRDEVNSSLNFRGWSAEIRWAPAEWNAIFGNPTLYFEYALNNGEADKIEPKLLLGGELARAWHWGMNLVYERALVPKSNEDIEYKVTAAVSYTLIDEALSLGPAVGFSSETEAEESSGVLETTNEFLIGPSLQWRPNQKAFLDLEPLFGVTKDSKRLDMFIVFGWKF